MTESPAAKNSITITALLLLVTGGIALALDGFHYTKAHEGNPELLEISADMSRQIVVPIWAGVGVLMLGGGLLMVPMNRRNPPGTHDIAQQENDQGLPSQGHVKTA